MSQNNYPQQYAPVQTQVSCETYQEPKMSYNELYAKFSALHLANKKLKTTNINLKNVVDNNKFIISELQKKIDLLENEKEEKEKEEENKFILKIDSKHQQKVIVDKLAKEKKDLHDSQKPIGMQQRPTRYLDSHNINTLQPQQVKTWSDEERSTILRKKDATLRAYATNCVKDAFDIQESTISAIKEFWKKNPRLKNALIDDVVLIDVTHELELFQKMIKTL